MKQKVQQNNQRGNPSSVSLIFACYVIVLIAIALCVLMTSCNKPEPSRLSCTFTMFSQQGKFAFRYIDADRNWHTDTITGQTSTRTVEILEADMKSIFSITGANVQLSDSAYIRVDVNSLRAEQGIHVLNNAAQVSVQPSQAK